MPKKLISLDELSRFKYNCDNKYAVPNGNYPTMTVGYADNLTHYGANSGAYDTTPFVFQTTGGSSDVGNTSYLRALRGNSVAFNQLVQNNASSQTLNDVVITKNANGSYTFNGQANANIRLVICSLSLINGHKYLLKGVPSGASATEGGYRLFIDSLGNQVANTIISNTYNGTVDLKVSIDSGANVNFTIFIQLFDLTLLGKEYDSVLAFNRDYPLQYYAYNQGTLLNSKSNGIKNVGYNAFDGELELGSISDTTGLPIDSDYSLRSKNFIKVIAGEKYTFEEGASGYITYSSKQIYEYDGNKNFIKYSTKFGGYSAYTIDLDTNTQYVKIRYYQSSQVTSIPANPEIAFHLTWDGSKTGYEPYKTETFTLPNVELKSASNVYDELKPDGTLITRVGSVDLGTLTWTSQTAYGIKEYYTMDISTLVKVPSANDVKANIVCARYLTTTRSSGVADSGVAIGTNGLLVIKSSSTLSDSAFKTSLNGVYLNYELATPTTTQISNTFQEIMPVDDFGTQEFLYDNDIAIPIPQGNDFFYPVDYKAFVDSLGGREDIEYRASAIVSQTQLSKYDELYAIMQENIGGALRHQISGIAFNNTSFVDLGTLSYSLDGRGRMRSESISTLIKKPSAGNVLANICCSKYEAKTADQTYSYQVGISIEVDGKISIYDTSLGSDPSKVPGLLKGVLLAYEKA